METEYDEVLTLVSDLIRFGASYTEAWNMDFRLYRHFINARRSAIEDSINNDRMLYTEQVGNIAKVFSKKRLKVPQSIKFDKFDTDNVRRRKDKKKKEKRLAKQRVMAWASFIHSYHTDNREDEQHGLTETTSL